MFISDKGGLFSSAKNRVGYSSYDGATYYYVEWTGDAAVGTKSAPTLRTQTGTVNLQSLQVIKAEAGVIWIMCKLTSGAEVRCVGKW